MKLCSSNNQYTRILSSDNHYTLAPEVTQVTQCFSSLTISLVSTTSIIQGKKNYDLHTTACIHNIARVNCCTCTYFFLKQTDCVKGGDRVQNVLWQAQDLPVISILKNVILCGTNYLFQDSPEDIADGIVEIVQTFQSSYNSINIAIGGILPCDASWSINWVLIIEVNQTLNAKCSKSFFIYIGYDSCWTFANGSLKPDFFILDNVHLVEKGNLKLGESIFSSIENCNGVTCNKHRQFLISYKIEVSFKLNNFDFPLLSFSAVSKPVYSVAASLSFATACSFSSDVSALSHKSLSDPVNICDGSVCSSNVCPIKPICPTKPACLNSVCPSKPIISKNFCLSKPVCPRNINSSRSFCSSNVCQIQSNVRPSKPVCLSKPVWKYVCKPVCPSNVTVNPM